MSRARSVGPRSVDHRLPAASAWTSTPGSAADLFPEPPAGVGPCRGERDALGAVGVAGEGAEFLEFGDGAFGIERHGPQYGRNDPRLTNAVFPVLPVRRP